MPLSATEITETFEFFSLRTLCALWLNYFAFLIACPPN